jgi:hypothetical protein
MSLVRVQWLTGKTKHIRPEICGRFLLSPSVASSTIPVAASASSSLSWNSQQNFFHSLHSLLLLSLDARTDCYLQALKINAFGEDFRLAFQANSTQRLPLRGFWWPATKGFPYTLHCFTCSMGHLDAPSCRNNMYFQTGYTSCNTVASMKLHIHIRRWIRLHKLDSTIFFPMQKPFRDGKGFLFTADA